MFYYSFWNSTNKEKEKMEPIRPEEVVARQGEQIPPEVIKAFNDLIVKNFIGGKAVISQKEVLDLLQVRGFDIGDISTKRFLDVEEIFRKAGWKVEYDKPGYNESYEASFTFTKPKK